METSESSGMKGYIEERIKDAVKSNNDALLSSISGMINKISGKSQCSFLDVPKFKRKSNEEQYKNNAKILENIDIASTAIDSNNTQSAKEALIEAEKALRQRQKLILMADTSELGWRVVNEYTTNPIASDSEDEKRIQKAEARAIRKAKSDKGKKPLRNWPYRRPEGSTVHGASAQTGFVRSRTGLCFMCGKPGHWKNECPQPVATNNKISTLSYCAELECINISKDVHIATGSLQGESELVHDS
ncbi:uncharacterized protein LOC127861933 [Dreissena polymorpha]|uniref:uncharacterized protein LOC127861933 n=1 Tax=Dreissena polymorpha TaxID=45954 RepID=UPI00226559D2|nr:uncharacterized protein LOC127861933 [Dreissena polymorpha]